jgi:hypothetical protein
MKTTSAKNVRENSGQIKGTTQSIKCGHMARTTTAKHQLQRALYKISTEIRLLKVRLHTAIAQDKWQCVNTPLVTAS